MSPPWRLYMISLYDCEKAFQNYRLLFSKYFTTFCFEPSQSRVLLTKKVSEVMFLRILWYFLNHKTKNDAWLMNHLSKNNERSNFFIKKLNHQTKNAAPVRYRNWMLCLLEKSNRGRSIRLVISVRLNITPAHDLVHPPAPAKINKQ